MHQLMPSMQQPLCVALMQTARIWRGSRQRALRWLAGLGLAIATVAVVQAQPAGNDRAAALRAQLDLAAPSVPEGATSTLLADGRWLVVGTDAQGAAQAQIFDPRAAAFNVLGVRPSLARAKHAAVTTPDGSIWFFGGVDRAGSFVSTVERWRPDTQRFETLPGLALLPRSGHSATQLLDGRVLLVGGVGAGGQPLLEAELVDPASRSVETFNVRLNTARFDHLAALLPSDYVLVYGGTGRDGRPLADGELYDRIGRRFIPLSQAPAGAMPNQPLALAAPALAGSLPADQANDVPVDTTIALRFSKPMRVDTLAAGNVALMGPAGRVGVRVVPAEGGMLAFVNPAQQLLPGASYSLVVNNIVDRNGQAMPLATLAFRTQVLAAGQRPGARVVAVGPAAGTAGQTPPTTPPAPVAIAADDDDEDWVPSGRNFKGEWISGRAERAKNNPPRRDKVREAVFGTEIARTLSDRAFRLPALSLQDAAAAVDPAAAPAVPGAMTDAAQAANANVQPGGADGLPQAPTGVTAIAGQVLRLNGRPLANVTLRMGAASVTTDSNGEFLLSNIPSGSQVLTIDGRSASQGNRVYGRYDYRTDVQPNLTNALPFVVWMPRLDTRNAVKIPSPTNREVVVRNPRLPGLELRIPAGTVIRDADGKIVTEVSITPVPVDQTPFPMPYFGVPIYFTLQPGGALIQGVDGKPRAATLHYPNYTHNGPGTVMELFDYDPKGRGWYIYSNAVVSGDGQRLDSVGKPFAIYQFTATSGASSGGPPPERPGPPPQPCPARNSNPVDCRTGEWLHQVTDLAVNDLVPLAVTRSYRTNDTSGGLPNVRAFGIGTYHPYEGYLVMNAAAQRIDVILADGRAIPFPAAPGTTCCFIGPNSRFEHLSTPGEFYGAYLSSVSGSGQITLYFRDGRKWGYNYYQARLLWMEDRNGNRVTLTRQSGTTGNVTRATGPSGRFIEFTYDASNRISSVRDNAGRTVSYAYDTSNRLFRVTDPENFSTEYTYDSAHRVLTVRDGRGNVRTTNEYYPTGDPNVGRVKSQTFADGARTQFAYTLNAQGRVIQTDITSPRGFVTRMTFSDASILTSETQALGTPLAQTVTHTVDPATNRVTATVDALNRRTEYLYDALGNVTRVTRLAGTPQAQSWNYTYDSRWVSFVRTMTDPAGRTTTFTYDSVGNLTEVRNGLNFSTRMTHDALGRLLTTARSPNGSTWLTTTYAYDGADLASITDPLNRVTAFFTDSIGRPLTVRDPLGQVTRTEYDGRSLVRRVIDPLGQVIEMTYDGNGNMTGFRDARNQLTQFAYDLRNRLSSKTDALNQVETYQYDLNGNPTRVTDRKGQVSGSTYDALDRRTRVGFGATVASPTAFTSTIDYTFDAGNRLTQAADSANGTIGRSYDGFDRLAQETSPQGQVDYTYHPNGLRAGMTATGQATVSYTYDAANRLTTIAQGAASVGFLYDQADRRTRVTLPNGLQLRYAYDAASQLTQIQIHNGTAEVGRIDYAYDTGGRRISQSGTWARSGLPMALASTTLDANNRLTQHNGVSLTYDANGNMTALGPDTYSWNARNQLTAISGSSTASFQYDALGRRVGKTINGTATSFLHDGWQIVRATEGANATGYLTGLALDEVYRRSTPTGSHDYLTDALGSILGLADSSQAITTSYTYEPYGGTTVQGAASANPMQYTGRENDGTGLYYYRNRYYSPMLSRFVSEDPIGLAGGVNLYGYVGGDPISLSDPTGLAPNCTNSRGRVTSAFTTRTIEQVLWSTQVPAPLATGLGPDMGPPERGRPRWRWEINYDWWMYEVGRKRFSEYLDEVRTTQWTRVCSEWRQIGRECGGTQPWFYFDESTFSTSEVMNSQLLREWTSSYSRRLYRISY